MPPVVDLFGRSAQPYTVQAIPSLASLTDFSHAGVRDMGPIRSSQLGAKMRAAVVEAFGAPPRYMEFSLPAPTRGEIQVEVLAAGLHPRVRSGASGTHYSSDGLLPLIPGVDGVGRLPSDDRVFFMTLNTSMGSMA